MKQRMKKRNTGRLTLVIALLIFVSLCGVVVAYMFQRTTDEVNLFVPAEVACEVQEETDTGTQTANQKTSITVKNTGNINAYLRVRLVSYWVKENNGTMEIVGKTSKMPKFTPVDGWISGENDTYYYKSPIVPQSFTPNLLASAIVLAEEDGCFQVVEVFAEAIQSKPADAVQDSWPVVLDENGNIQSAS